MKTTAIEGDGYRLHQDILIGFVIISQVVLVMARGRPGAWLQLSL